MRLILVFSLIIFSLEAFSQEGKPTNVPTLNSLPILTNSVELNKKNVAATTLDNEVIYKSIKSIEKDLKKGTKYYKSGKYKKAYGILSELAQWGIKTPQALVGMMYIKGQHVDQSIETGMAWLGVANEIDMEESKKTFDYVYGQLNDAQKKGIDDKVAKYIAQYGMEIQNLVCKKRTALGSNIPVMDCVKQPGSNSPLYPIEG